MHLRPPRSRRLTGLFAFPLLPVPAPAAFDLSAQTALVTACNRGIGLAMAVGLAEAGAAITGV